jgi:cell division transport system permease protein
MKLKQINYLVSESFRTLGRHKGITTLSIVIMSLTLLILAVFLLATDNMLLFMTRAKAELHVYVYLDDRAGQPDIEDHYKTLLAMEEVETITFISKHEAMEEFKEYFGEENDLLRSLEANPLPSSFRVMLKDQFRTLEAFEAFAAKASPLHYVDEVSYGRAFLEKFSSITRAFLYIDAVLGVIVVLSSIFIIANTVRLTIVSRQKTIEILKLVGGTNRFITTPFIIEGAFQGGIASLVSLILLFTIYTFSKRVLPDAAFFSFNSAVLYMLICVILGALGSLAAMKRYLRL